MAAINFPTPEEGKKTPILDLSARCLGKTTF